MQSPCRARTRTGVVALVAALILAAACGGGSGSGSDEARDDSALPQSAPADQAGFTFGNELVLTADGPSDEILVANVQLDIVVRNETSAPQTLRFTNGALDDGRVEVGPIAPGGEERWRATTTVTRQWELVSDPSYHGTLATDPGTFGDPNASDYEG